MFCIFTLILTTVISYHKNLFNFVIFFQIHDQKLDVRHGCWMFLNFFFSTLMLCLNNPKLWQTFQASKNFQVRARVLSEDATTLIMTTFSIYTQHNDTHSALNIQHNNSQHSIMALIMILSIKILIRMTVNTMKFSIIIRSIVSPSIMKFGIKKKIWQSGKQHSA